MADEAVLTSVDRIAEVELKVELHVEIVLVNEMTVTMREEGNVPAWDLHVPNSGADAE